MHVFQNGWQYYRPLSKRWVLALALAPSQTPLAKRPSPTCKQINTHRPQVLQQAERQAHKSYKQQHNAAAAMRCKPFAAGDPERAQCYAADVGQQCAGACKGAKEEQDEAALGDNTAWASSNGVCKRLVAIMLEEVRGSHEQPGGQRVGSRDKQREGHAREDAGA